MFGWRKKTLSSAIARRCSFCNKSQHDVRKLIAGPKVYICDECVDICLDILSKDRHDAPYTAAPLSTPVWCGLCHISTPFDDMVMIPDRGFLCARCVAAVREGTE